MDAAPLSLHSTQILASSENVRTNPVATQPIFDSPRPAAVTLASKSRVELPDEIQKILTRTLPAEAIGKHPRIEGLSSINPAFVVERLIEAFGNGGWEDSVAIVDRDSRMETWNAGKPNEKQVKIFIATVHLTFTVEKYGLHKENFGGCDNVDLGDALKGARTDALTKIASELGVGLEVYKSGRNAEETTPNCPSCGKKLRRSRDNAGWYCWAKKDGCGLNITDEALKAATESKSRAQQTAAAVPQKKEPQSANGSSSQSFQPAQPNITVAGLVEKVQGDSDGKLWIKLCGSAGEYACVTMQPELKERLRKVGGKNIELLVSALAGSQRTIYQILKVVSVDWKGVRQ